MNPEHNENIKPVEESKPSHVKVINPKKEKNGTGGTGKKKTLSATETLLKLVDNGQITLFRDERKQPYAKVSLDGKSRILSIRSKEFEDYLGFLAYSSQEWSPGNEVIANVVRTLAGKARYEGEEHELQIRTAWHEDSIWIDLDGSRAVRVTPDGWTIENDPPILFRSFPHQKPLPEPDPNGDMTRMLEFLNLQNDHSILSILTYTITALVPGIPCSVLLVYGPQGSAKSSLLRVLKAFIDPSELELHVDIRKSDSLQLTAWQSHMFNIDNVTEIPDWLSNAICCFATGAGQSTRVHYTMEDLNILNVKRVVGISGINLVIDRPDLLDRSILIRLQPIPPSRRRQELELDQSFKEAMPSIFGGILNTLSRAMKIKPEVKLKRPPRMIDFALWSASAALALGYSLDDYQRVVDHNFLLQNEAALDANPVAQAVFKLVISRGSWFGSPTELLSQLNLIASDLQIRTSSNDWPKSPTWVTRRLRELEVTLGALGIVVQVNRNRSGSVINLNKASDYPFTDGAEILSLPVNSDDENRDNSASLGTDSNIGKVVNLPGFTEEMLNQPTTLWPPEIQTAFEEQFAYLAYYQNIPEEDARVRALEFVRKEYLSKPSDDDSNTATGKRCPLP